MKKKSSAIKRCIWITAIIGVIVILALGIGAIARYMRTTEEVTNTFSPAVSIIPPINEENENGDEFSDGDKVKKNVTISVDNNKPTEYPVYVRAEIDFTWQYFDADDNRIASFTVPKKGTDYKIIFNEDDWTLHNDGFYYYNYIVPSGGTTTALINECTALKDYTDNYGNHFTLNVTIIAQTIQAVGYTDEDSLKKAIPAVEDAWGWKENDLPKSFHPKDLETQESTE